MDSPIVQPNSRSKKPVAYHALATRKGLRWLGPYTGRVIDQTMWECPKGHRFSADYSNLSKPNYGCPECSRCQPEDYHAMAKSRGFVWLGPAVRNSTTPTRWRCSYGHEWEAPYRYLRDGKGCPTCGNVHRRSAKRKVAVDYYRLAVDRGFRWLGPEVHITKQHTWWECAQGHQWRATYNTIRAGKGCPDCYGTFVNGNLASKQQIAIADMVGGEINYMAGRKAIDVVIFSRGDKIAIEYDSWYWHGGKLQEDEARLHELLRLGWLVIRIKSCNKLPPFQALYRALIELTSGQSAYEEITLDDWGKGDTWHDVKSRGF